MKNLSNIFLISDMDGTLLNSEHQLSKRNRLALERFVEKGGKFTVATGRMEESVKRYLHDLPINIPAILYNGAVIYDLVEDQPVWIRGLELCIIELIQELVRLFPGIGIEVYELGRVSFITHNEETERHQQKEKLPNFKIDITELSQPLLKVLLAWNPEHLLKVEEHLLSRAGHLPFYAVRSEPQFLEILPLNVSKGTALKRLMTRLNLSQENIVLAIGDHLNDLELLQMADVGIAVANAHHRLKEVAQLHTCHHDEDALVELVEWIESYYKD